METHSDLFVQSSIWSSYKHHNTAKFLIGCTPNGAVSYISQLYVGSISDVALIKVSGYLDTLNNKGGVSVMADRGFTVCAPSTFLDGTQQLTSEEIQRGCQISSLCIHVEGTIGRIKNCDPERYISHNHDLTCEPDCVCLCNFSPTSK